MNPQHSPSYALSSNVNIRPASTVSTDESEHTMTGDRDAQIPTTPNSKFEPDLQPLVDRFRNALNDSNAFLAFVGPIAVFMASVNATLLSYAHDKFSDRKNPDGSEATERAAEHTVYACFFLSILLSITPGAFAWLTHSSTLQMITSATSAKRKAPRNDITKDNLERAIAQLKSFGDSRFWIANFLCPAVVALYVGVIVLVWSNHSNGVALVTTIGLAYCIVQVTRVIRALAHAQYEAQSSQA